MLRVVLDVCTHRKVFESQNDRIRELNIINYA